MMIESKHFKVSIQHKWRNYIYKIVSKETNEILEERAGDGRPYEENKHWATERLVFYERELRRQNLRSFMQTIMLPLKHLYRWATEQ